MGKKVAGKKPDWGRGQNIGELNQGQKRKEREQTKHRVTVGEKRKQGLVKTAQKEGETSLRTRREENRKKAPWGKKGASRLRKRKTDKGVSQRQKKQERREPKGPKALQSKKIGCRW